MATDLKPAPPGARVYMLRVWTGPASQPAFRVLVRRVESEQWLGFTSTRELLAYLLRCEDFARPDER